MCNKRLPIKRHLILAGLCGLFLGCSTGGNPLPPERMQGSIASDTTDTSLGIRYLLGRGERQDDQKAFYYFNKAANHGDAFAANEVAYLYATGKGTVRDRVKAFQYYEQAATQGKGLASAQYNVGLMYEYGLGTAPNQALAEQWYQRAAQNGFEPAKRALLKKRLS